LAASRAAELTKQLLSFARRGPLEARPVHVDNLISEVVTLLRRTIDPRIVLEIPTAPPPPPVWADPGQIGQVLLNLCLNARDAMPDGGTLRLSAAQASSKKSEEPHGHVRLRVEDTGCGMDAATQARLFEPFFTTKLRGKGTGLGLAMACGIARQHNGWIECHSAPGRGSCFDLYLPCAHHQAVPAPTNDTPMSEHPTTGGATVLLVDDEEPVRTLAATVLTRNGYDVLHAVDGVEGLDIYRRERDRIDLILLDLTMPRLSGLDTLKRLQELNPDVRVLLTSGCNNQSAVDPKKARFHGFVPKPYKAAELLRAIVAALAVRPSQLVQSEMSSTLTASQPSPAVTQTF
jgi:CheY-like chemotaxis protein